MDSDPFSRLSKVIVATIAKVADFNSIDHNEFASDLVSPKGSKQKRPPHKRTREEQFLFASLGLVGAYVQLRDDGGEWSRKVIGIRHSKLSDRLLTALMLSWDRLYIVRERMRHWSSVVELSDGATDEIIFKIKEIIKEYKNKTDKLLKDRGSHIHSFDIHHPLIEQLKIFEILWSEPPILDDDVHGQFGRSLMNSSIRRAKRVIAEEISGNESEFLRLSRQALENILKAFSGSIIYRPSLQIKIDAVSEEDLSSG